MTTGDWKGSGCGVCAKFGYYPRYCEIEGEHFLIQTLPQFEDSVRCIEESERCVRDWIYSGERRIFQLPKTHVLTLYNNSCLDDLEFVVWCLSFFTGMRLTIAQAGFLDATPVKPGKLVDFILINGSTISDVVALSLKYIENHNSKIAVKRVAAIIHVLFLSQYPENLQFEKFQYLYMALDGCYRLMVEARQERGKITHSGRVEWMCQQFGMAVPPWANSSAATDNRLSGIRNGIFHEALFFDEPLGFALYNRDQLAGTPRNILLEMQALVCRLLVAILGRPDTSYVKSPINTRQLMGLDLI